MAYKYWFDIPTLEDREIHVTPWDFIGLFSDLPPPLVAAVRKQDLRNYKNSNFRERVGYTFDNGGIGTLIPDADLLTQHSTVEGLREIINSIGRFPEENFSSKMEELLLKLFPVHHNIPDGKTTDPKYRFGLSNNLIPALDQQTGDCYQKTTFTAATCPERYEPKIVGFREFDLDVWKQVCEKYHSFEVQETTTQIPFIFQHLFDGCPVGPQEKLAVMVGLKLELDLNKAPMKEHYWVEISINGTPNYISTVAQSAREDPTYQFFMKCLDKLKYQCATCNITPI